MPIIQQNVNLSEYNTFRIKALAKEFVKINSLEEAKEIFKKRTTQKFLILGGGSNLLFLNDFNGIVIKNDLKGIFVIEETPTQVRIKAAAGENWHEFVLFCLKNNWGGLENLSLIPGTVGACPIQNIGAYGVEVKDTIESVQTMEISTQKEREFLSKDCQFGYRDSIFKSKYKHQFLILSVVFRLQKLPHTFHLDYGAIREELGKSIKTPSIQAISEAVIRIRKSKLPDPNEIGNAGSFFKNPEISVDLFQQLTEIHPKIPHFVISGDKIKIPAGWLIEQCGWKGYREGEVGVHQKQALVLVNFGHAKGLEIKKLAQKIQKSVLEKFKISLEAEVNWV